MTDNEIKKAIDNDIIKALEDWLKNFEGKTVDYMKISFALNLINRQKAEFERLEKDSKRLKKVQMQLDDAMKMYTTIKAEAIKEFAERLKETGARNSAGLIIFVESNIDKIIKEMVGEG